MNLTQSYSQQQQKQFHRLQQQQQQQQPQQHQLLSQDGSLQQLSLQQSSVGPNYSLQYQQQQQQQSQTQHQQSQSNQQQNEPTPIDPSLMNTQHWQQQLQLAQLSRQSSSPHTYARTAAIMSRSNPQQPQNHVLTVAELARQFVQQNHQTQQIAAVSHSASSPKTPVKAHAQLAVSTSNSKREYQEDERQRMLNEGSKQFWTALDLSGQGLVVVSPKVANYSFLQKLYLCHNNLTFLPDAITNLVHLKVLDVSHNHITELPERLGLLYNLKFLFLFDNKLRTLPSTFGQLFQLDFLGVEGNPLSESIVNTLAKEGTKGLVTEFRENVPRNTKAPPRDWLSFDTSGQIVSKLPIALSEDEKVPSEFSQLDRPKNRFTILSYNTLCDFYATPSMYGYTPSWALDWEYRSKIVLKELLTFSADIICLQEVDRKSFDNIWVPKLNTNGYKSIFGQKTRAKTMNDIEAKRVDGCATFYKGNKFKFIESKTLEYSTYAMQKTDLKKTNDVFNRVMNKDNVAVVTVLEHLETKQLVLLANTHIHWDPAYKDVKVVQCALLLEFLETVAQKYVKNSAYSHLTDIKHLPVVVCGDFNSTLDSGVYHLFSTGKIANHEDMDGRSYGKYTEEGISHAFSFQSSYANIGELPFTNFTPNFVEVIDYIWHTTSGLQVTGLLDKLDPEYTKSHIGIPDQHYPSDHIPIMAEFEIKRGKDSTKPPAPRFNTSSSSRRV